MTIEPILVATWTDGVFVLTGDSQRQELAGQQVRGLTPDSHGSALTIVNEHSLCRRSGDGEWSTIATSDLHLACVVNVGNVTYVGTENGADVLRVSASGEVSRLGGFDTVAGRDTWFAGSALINGQVVGPPLGVRSITATSDGVVLLANVHVGGIPRSTDGGLTWQPTIDVRSDVHEVRAHPSRPGVVIAAAANGLWSSSDAGATWTGEQAGLHGYHCCAVAFAGDDLLVSAATDHFAAHGALYRRAIDRGGPLEPIGGGLPEWLDGIVDTGCIAVRDRAVAMSDRGGNVYVSPDAGRTWSRRANGLPPASSVLV
ncbi:MAG: hypothetical protein ABI442_15170 [Gemmatimonadaceae bacterium]